MKFLLRVLLPLGLIPLVLIPRALMGENIFSVTVNCGSGPVSGMFSVSCSTSDGSSSADASITFSSSLFGLGVEADAGSIIENLPPATASAVLSADFLVTISGFAGTGFYESCLLGGSDTNGSISAVITGGMAISESGHSNINTCVNPEPETPFTFGQPFLVNAMFAAGASGPHQNGADVVFQGFEVTHKP